MASDYIHVTLIGGGTARFSSGTPVTEALSVLVGSVDDFVAARVDGRLVDMDTPLQADGTVEGIRGDSDQGLEILRHSASHIMAQAVRTFFPEAKIAIGPAIENGFYYDFD